jgi:hypothetical protein
MSGADRNPNMEEPQVKSFKPITPCLLVAAILGACSEPRLPTESSDSKPTMRVISNQSFTVGPFTSTHPCTGEPITYSGQAHQLIHETTTPSGDEYFMFHVNLQGVNGVTASGARFVLVQTSNDRLQFREGEESAMQTLTHNAITGDNSPNFLAHTTFKISIDANNQTTVEVMNIRAECQGEEA